jgi:L-alanine-DL-glutamate epimerase-like enolase superfamily enzyme
VKIKEIRALGLHGATPEGGWSAELRAEDCVHTLIEVITDDGLTEIGSVYTSAALVEAALQVLRPLYTEESAIEPERVSEKLHQHTFWQGRGGGGAITIPSAGLTSPCGISSARSRPSPSAACWEAATRSASSRTHRC